MLYEKISDTKLRDGAEIAAPSVVLGEGWAAPSVAFSEGWAAPSVAFSEGWACPVESERWGVPREETLMAVSSAFNFSRVNNNSVSFKVERDTPTSNAESVGRGRKKINERLSPTEWIFLCGVPFQLFFNALLNWQRKFSKFTISLGSEFNALRHEGDYNLRSAAIFSNGINPFRFASSMPLRNASAYSCLTGRRLSNSSMSQPEGFADLEWYSSWDSLSTSASSIRESTSSNANVSKIKSCGALLRSSTTPARDPFSSGNTDFGDTFSQETSLASESLAGESFLLTIWRKCTRKLKELSNNGDVPWEKISSIKRVGKVAELREGREIAAPSVVLGEGWAAPVGLSADSAFAAEAASAQEAALAKAEALGEGRGALKYETLLSAVGVGAMADAGNHDDVLFDKEFSAPVANLKPMSSFGIVVKTLGKGKWVWRAAVLVELLYNAFLYIGRKIFSVLLGGMREKKLHESGYRTPTSSLIFSMETARPSLISRSASFRSLLSAILNAGLNDSISSTVSSSSNASAFEILHPDASATAIRFPSFSNSQLGIFGLESPLRNVSGFQIILSSLSLALSNFIKRFSMSVFGFGISISSGSETKFRSVLTIWRKCTRKLKELSTTLEVLCLRHRQTPQSVLLLTGFTPHCNDKNNRGKIAFVIKIVLFIRAHVLALLGNMPAVIAQGQQIGNYQRQDNQSLNNISAHRELFAALVDNNPDHNDQGYHAGGDVKSKEGHSVYWIDGLVAWGVAVALATMRKRLAISIPAIKVSQGNAGVAVLGVNTPITSEPNIILAPSRKKPEITLKFIFDRIAAWYQGANNDVKLEIGMVAL